MENNTKEKWLRYEFSILWNIIFTILFFCVFLSPVKKKNRQTDLKEWVLQIKSVITKESWLGKLHVRILKKKVY
jgi:hypothetical protein